ncbi:lipase [Actinorhabdospora filicis]|uniref:Lipase n=1 Tax=Actinorhabdospora filicis TaxID=1785913 RepID=A0A9W6SJF8_9ACTN|nr:lipase [Actinorhabdospora filicis]GLZ76741.1 lipase [Actinorhabdospora filicis]
MKITRALAATTTTAAIILALPAMATAKEHGPQRGDVLNASFVRTVGLDEIRTGLTDEGVDVSSLRYEVDLHRVEYSTVDPWGSPIMASGLLALPHNRDKRLTAVSFAHGTESNRVGVPSVPNLEDNVWDQAPAWLYSSSGFATLMPDYLGLGTGPGRHPWFHLPTETTASMDMLRASDSYVKTLHRKLNGEVMVTGFSQGASAALGLAKVLDAGRDGAGRHRFELGAVGAVSGAYDMAGAEVPALLGAPGQPKLDPKLSVLYTTYLLTSWEKTYDIYGSPAEIFQSPWDQNIESLFDGDHSGKDIFTGTPGTVAELLTPQGKALLEHPGGRFAKALAAESRVCSFAPDAPVRLYVTRTDAEAASTNTDSCAAKFDAAGKDVSIVDLGATDHAGSHLRSMGDLVRWFQTI